MKSVLAVLAVIAAALLMALSVAQAARGPSALDYARQAAELDAIQRSADLAAQWEPIRAGVVNLAFAIVVLGVAVAIVTALGVAVWRFFRERRTDAAGRLPVPVQQLPQLAGPALASFHAVCLAEAQRQPVPHDYSPHTATTEHYSPRLDYRTDAGRLTGESACDAPTLVAPPSFGELLHAGRVGRGPDGRALPLLLGFDTTSGAELLGSWLDLYSTAVGGLPGSGKTTTQRFLACQTALAGARFVVIDPHAGAGSDSLAATLAPLRAAYLCEAASDDRRILEAVRLVADIGERRVQGRDRDTTPVILWADELTKLLGRSAIGDELAALLEAVAQEYRKKQVFVCGSGQIWTAARTTSELRDSFASVIAHRMKRAQGRMLLPTEEAAQVERLEVGQAVLWRTSGATATVHIPLTTGADVQRVAGLLAGAPSTQDATGRAAEGVRKTDGSAVEGTLDAPSSAPGRSPVALTPMEPESARILARFAGGATLPDLVRELVGSTSGRKADEARARIEALLRAQLGGVA